MDRPQTVDRTVDRNVARTVDPHSHSRPDQIAVRHLALDLTVDFDERRLSGTAALELDRRSPDATTVVLDTWELAVDAVTTEDGADLSFELGEHHPVLGRALTIQVGTADRVVVHYATGEGARALQWLEPAQTASGKRFLFSQAQPILARSWIPCQDSPAVRMTYDARCRYRRTYWP